MKSLHLLSVAAAAVVLAGPALPGHATAAPAKAAPGAAAFTPTRPQERRLDSGLRVVVFPDRRRPIVQVQLTIPAGVAHEPAGKAGVAQATAQLLRQGTTSRSAQQLATEAEALGGQLSAAASRDFSTVSGAFLAAGFATGLELLADAATRPVFLEAEVERLRTQSLEAVRQIRLNPASLADEHLWALAQAGHPYERPLVGTPEGIAALTREDVRSFHRDFYRPDRAVLVIAGDVEPERAFAAAQEWFGAWSGRSASAAVPPTAAPPEGVRIRIVDQPLGRCEIRAALPGPARSAPDGLALQLATAVLGGVPGARLAAEPGGPRSQWSALREGGMVLLAAGATPDSVPLVVERIRAALARLAAEGPTAAEAEAARRLLRGAFPLQFETLGGVIAQWTAADVYGLPPDHLASQRGQIAATTDAEIAAAARRWLDPARLEVVVVGPAARLEPALAVLGKVEVVAPATPAARPAEPAPTAEQLEQGRRVVARALEAHGGLAKLRGIKDSNLSGEMAIMSNQTELTGQIDQTRQEPWKMSLATKFMGFETRQVLNGRRAWSRYAGDSVKVTEEDSLGVEALRSGFSSDVPHLLLAAAARGSQVVSRGRQFVDGAEAEAVDVTAEGQERRRLYFDVKTRRLAAMDQSESGRGEFSVRRLYRDYRDVSGVQLPFYEERLLHGRRVMVLTVRRASLNAGVNSAQFERPAEGEPAQQYQH